MAAEQVNEPPKYSLNDLKSKCHNAAVIVSGSESGTAAYLACVECNQPCETNPPAFLWQVTPETTPIANPEKTKNPLLGPDGKFKVGNPGGPGRPKGSLSLKTMLQNKLNEMVETTEGQKVKLADAIISATINQAIVKSDARVLKLLWNYLEGMPTQPIELRQLPELDPETEKAVDDFLNGEK